jgi:hypothetical protein
MFSSLCRNSTSELEGIGGGGGGCLSLLRSSTKVLLISCPIFDMRLLGLTSLLVGDIARRGRFTLANLRWNEFRNFHMFTYLLEVRNESPASKCSLKKKFIQHWFGTEEDGTWREKGHQRPRSWSLEGQGLAMPQEVELGGGRASSTPAAT